MPNPISPEERAARRMIADDKAIAIKLAEQQAHGYQKHPASPDEEYDLYWFADPMVSEQALYAEMDPQTGQPLTRAQIAYKVYPKRRKVIYGGERALDLDKRIKFVEQMNARHDREMGDMEPDTADTMEPSEPGEGAY
jgi:hypothetical protein